MKFFIFAFILPFLAVADVPSNTVPTNEIMASFEVIQYPAGSFDALALADLTQVKITDGRLFIESLEISKDDVLTFSNGGKTITYDPANPESNILPFVGGAQYTVRFARYNGEIYKGTTTTPKLVTFSMPEAGQVFQKTDTVDIVWSADKEAADFFVLIDSDCDAFDSGKLAFNDDYTKAQILAGAADNCPAGTKVMFYPIYINYGTGYGSFYSISFGAIEFYYGTKSTSALKTLSRKELTRYLKIAKSKKMKALRVKH
jgi:hypothetical protein